MWTWAAAMGKLVLKWALEELLQHLRQRYTDVKNLDPREFVFFNHIIALFHEIENFLIKLGAEPGGQYSEEVWEK